MTWLKRHSTAVAEPPGATQKPVEDLVRPFGWSHIAGEAWSCENVQDQPGLTTPELCAEVMSAMAAKLGEPGVFNPGLIFLGQLPLIVSSSKPRPFSVTTGMRTANAAANLIALLAARGYTVMFVGESAFAYFSK